MENQEAQIGYVVEPIKKRFASLPKLKLGVSRSPYLIILKTKSGKYDFSVREVSKKELILLSLAIATKTKKGRELISKLGKATWKKGMRI